MEIKCECDTFQNQTLFSSGSKLQKKRWNGPASSEVLANDSCWVSLSKTDLSTMRAGMFRTGGDWSAAATVALRCKTSQEAHFIILNEQLVFFWVESHNNFSVFSLQSSKKCLGHKHNLIKFKTKISIFCLRPLLQLWWGPQIWSRLSLIIKWRLTAVQSWFDLPWGRFQVVKTKKKTYLFVTSFTSCYAVINVSRSTEKTKCLSGFQHCFVLLADSICPCLLEISPTDTSGNNVFYTK